MKSILLLIFLLLTSEGFSQDGTTSTRRRSGSRSGSGSSSSSTMTLEDCQNSDCNCCVFLSRRAGAVCKTDHIRMDNEEELWGTAYFMDINSNFITIFNATPEQIEIIRTTLSVLPAGYLAAVPISIRIGNPRNGSKTVRSGGTVGGGSRRCNTKSPDYEYIIIHPDAFDRGQSPRMTILHEVGHFVDREYQLSASLVGEYAD